MPDQVVLVIRATDTNGTGLFTDVPLVVSINRINVAKPKFIRDSYYSKLNEKDTQFDPVLILEVYCIYLDKENSTLKISAKFFALRPLMMTRNS